MELFKGKLNEEVKTILAGYNKKETVAIVSGLLVNPEYHSNNVRMEALLHYSLLHCKGGNKTTRTTFEKCLNKTMTNLGLASFEDPIEDVFVSSIMTEEGDLRVINSVWEGNDYYAQLLLDVAGMFGGDHELSALRKKCLNLVRLSEAVASRAGLERNEYSKKSKPKERISLPNTSQLDKIGRLTCFDEDGLKSIGLNEEALIDFVYHDIRNSDIINSRIGHSPVERRPIVKFGSELILALPGSVSVAIRRFFLEECSRLGFLSEFEEAMDAYQANLLSRAHFVSTAKNKYLMRGEEQALGMLPKLNNIVIEWSDGRYVQFLILSDSLKNIHEEGLDSFFKLSDDGVTKVEAVIDNTSKHFRGLNNFKHGLTVVTTGGLGRGVNISLPKSTDGWDIASLSFSDILLLSNSYKEGMTDFVECMIQKSWVVNKNVSIFNVNGDINYFGFWIGHNYQCLPEELGAEQGGMLNLYTDFVFPVRSGARAESDLHSCKDHDGSWLRVERLTKDAFYEGMRHLPIYISPWQISTGFLNGVVETSLLNVWFGIWPPSNVGGELIYEWWSSILNMLHDLIGFASAKTSFTSCGSFQVQLDTTRLKDVGKTDPVATSQTGVDVYHDENGECSICLQENFLSNFCQPENYGEKLIAYVIVKEIKEFLQGKGVEDFPEVDFVVNNVLDDQGVRIIHLFNSKDATEALLGSEASKPVFFNEKLMTFRKIVVGNALGVSSKTLEGKKSCGSYLGKAVSLLWEEIRDEIKKCDKLGLVQSLCSNLLSIEQDRKQWKTTAKALHAIHEKHDNTVEVSGRRESKRSLTSMSCRALIEMAVCECELSEHVKEISHKDLESLISKCALLIQIASDSDAIHWGMVPPFIEIANNGTYSVQADTTASVVVPYFNGHFKNQFEDAVEAYSDLYDFDDHSPHEAAENTVSGDFRDAFYCEHGFSIDVYIDCFAEIIDTLVERDATSLHVTEDWLINKICLERGLDASVVAVFLESFSLKPRASWENPPKPFVNRDIAPWKHKRRLSCLILPILKLSDEDIFLDLSLIKQSISYFLERAEKGEFNTEFFRSDAMRSYVGSMVELRGREFTNAVKTKLEEIGWIVKSEVLMSTLGAPDSLGDLGDVDVLALSDEGKLLAIECKRLQMAKTISEIADVCNRFRGEEKDELSKHLTRVGWITENLQKVQVFLGGSVFIKDFDHALVTSTSVPMKYVEDLPIDNDRIVSYREIEQSFLGL
ncbi:hypothetical protein P1P91_09250 [Halomonas piscis]|uniref:Restriction endonuclease type IV Mrr domain-containing protein n=1 Tax=Halomonas piscis TaxID=3031727 RepID=A0ABY9YW58_9GAMM|nr:hypothetical protein [Halomonas piscis]WNK19066.1 hypothetical protein P1P91_09250 [Halomonas piscis]